MESREYTTRKPLWGHQRTLLDRSYDRRGYGYFTGMGTGKTKSALDLVTNRRHQVVLVVTLTSILIDGHWERQIHEFGPDPITNIVTTIALKDGSSKQKANQLREKAQGSVNTPNSFCFVIVNYESVWRGELGKLIRQIGWDCVIADEAHKLKAAGSKVSKFMASLKSGQRLALTGSPNPNSPDDTYGLFRFIDPEAFGTRHADFLAEYAILGGESGKQILKFKNLDKMRTIMERYSYYVDREEVLDLPPYQDIYRRTDLEDDAWDLYEALRKEFVGELRSGGLVIADNVLVKMLRLQQIASGFAQDQDGKIHPVSTAKARLLDDTLDEIGNKEPMVIFTHFKHDVEVVTARLKNHAISYSLLTGDTKGHVDWRKGKAIALVSNIQSGSQGLDFTRSRYVVYFNKPHSYGLYDQSRARVHRPGQTRPVTYVHLVVRKTIDELILRAHQEKRDLIDYLLDIYKER